MSELELLPETLRQYSASDREIALRYAHAVAAAKYLAAREIAIPAWEGWLVRFDGTRGHSKIQGTVWLEREPAEPWGAYVNRCLVFTLEAMTKDDKLFSTTEEATRGDLYFCFSVRQAAHG
jgi:hypothetical protein